MASPPSFPQVSWRLLHTPPAPGAWNMAVDEAILEAMGRGASRPTLRLYAWNPPCLSLGYAQPARDADPVALAAHGWDLVRRPTGGRAILHTAELTYAVCGPQEDPRLAGSVFSSYRNLAQALLRALHLLAIPAQALPEPGKPSDNEAAGGQNPVCFEVPSNYEITVGGKKLIGSAQARRKEGVLQHGSLPLYGDLARITQALVFSSEAERTAAAERLLSRATTAEAVLGYPLSWDAAARAWRQAFGGVLNIQFEMGELSESERTRADELVAIKYAHPSWTGRV